MWARTTKPRIDDLLGLQPVSLRAAERPPRRAGGDWWALRHGDGRRRIDGTRARRLMPSGKGSRAISTRRVRSCASFATVSFRVVRTLRVTSVKIIVYPSFSCREHSHILPRGAFTLTPAIFQFTSASAFLTEVSRTRRD